jgi:hypothetical protein
MKPEAITDLSALSTASVGEAALTWISPDDGYGSAVTDYTIKYATFNVNSLGGDTTAWWNGSSTYINSISPAAPGTTENFTLQDLYEGTSYYFAVKSVNQVGEVSPIDKKSDDGIQDSVIPKPFTPKQITDLAAAGTGNSGEMKLTWTSPDDGKGTAVSSYTVRYATFSVSDLSGDSTGWWNMSTVYANSLTPAVPGSTQSLVVGGLPDYTSYYFAIKSVNSMGIESAIDTNAQDGLQDTDIPEAYSPNAVTDMISSATGSIGEIELSWTSPSDGYGNAVVSYVVKFATFGISSLGGDTTAWWLAVSDASSPAVSQGPGKPENII